MDCRINAYPSNTGWKGLNRQAPNFLFIDLNLSKFKSMEGRNRVLNKTLKFIIRVFPIDLVRKSIKHVGCWCELCFDIFINPIDYLVLVLVKKCG